MKYQNEVSTYQTYGLENKFYRFPRKLGLNPFFWSKSIKSITVFLYIAIRCSSTINRTSAYVGARAIERNCNLSKSDVAKRIDELVLDELPLLIKSRNIRGSKPFLYRLTDISLPKSNNDRFFPVFGQLFTKGVWNSLSDSAKIVYLFSGGVSFQPKDHGKKLFSDCNKYAWISHIESVIDEYEYIKCHEGKIDNFIVLEKVFQELENSRLIIVKKDKIKIPILNL